MILRRQDVLQEEEAAHPGGSDEGGLVGPDQEGVQCHVPLLCIRQQPQHQVTLND